MSVEHFEPQLPFYDPGETDRFQRLEIIDHIHGFLSASKPEQVEAMGLESFIRHPGGAAKHLGEVVTRQRKQGVADPMAAARALTRNYIDYAQDAKQSGKELAELDATLSDIDNPELILDRVLDISAPGLVRVLRFYELSQVKINKDKAIKDIGYDPQRINYVPENGGLIPYLHMAIESWRVRQARQLSRAALASEASRFTFWTDRMSEVSKSYPKLKPIVTDGFNAIYDRAASSVE